jgi:hypothetical protein
MQYFLIIPTLYLARLFLDCVVFTPWFGALSLFYLSALQPSSSGSVVVKMEKSLQSAQATEMKYASRENYLRGKEYVECAAINPEFIASSRSGRMLMELDKLRSKHFTLN